MSSEFDQVLEDVQFTAEGVAQIIGAHLPYEKRDAVTAELVEYVRSLHRTGGSQIECMIVLGALHGMGFEDFDKL